VRRAVRKAGSGLIQFEFGLVLIGAGAALAMTPATNAIVSSLLQAKQGVASAVNVAFRGNRADAKAPATAEEASAR
jgi:hypothetical protein